MYPNSNNHNKETQDDNLCIRKGKIFYTYTKEIREYILDNTRSSTSTRINTSNNIITITLPNTVEDTRVGIKGLPLLRITSWNKEQQYKQFLNPIYVPVHYT